MKVASCLVGLLLLATSTVQANGETTIRCSDPAPTSTPLALEPGSSVVYDASGYMMGSYVVYLPTNYKPDGSAPLLILMDANGSGHAILNEARAACEARGWVGVGCFGLANGVYAFLYHQRFNDILEDLRHRIPHDRTRTYVGGFSGGSWAAHWMARMYWNEFAGVVSYSGWIGDYDDYSYFPDRLAVARTRGVYESDYAELLDAFYYQRSAVRWINNQFDGGHGIPPWPYTLQALEWLDQDFAQNGAAYLPDATQSGPLALRAQACEALDAGAHTAAAHAVAMIFEHYPFSPQRHDAQHLLTQLYGNDEAPFPVLDLPAQRALALAKQFVQRGLWHRVTERQRERRAYFEVAVMLDPTNARALAELAHAVLETDPGRAEHLAEQATDMAADSWHAWLIRARVAAWLGDYATALAYAQMALDRTNLHHDSGQYKRIRALNARDEYSMLLTTTPTPTYTPTLVPTATNTPTATATPTPTSVSLLRLY